MTRPGAVRLAENAGEPVLRNRIEDLVRGFPAYLLTFHGENPFSEVALREHTRTIRLRSQLETVCCALGSEEFVRSLYSTLESFGMNQRGARLVSLECFSATLSARSAEIACLEEKRLDRLGTEVRDVTDALWMLIDTLRLTQTKSRLVAGTKALHHILPKLVPPMDRAYTGAFFGWSPQRIQNDEARFFKLVFPVYAEVAKRVQPDRHAGEGWNTCIAKVIDNAVVGYCKQHRLDDTSLTKVALAKARELGFWPQTVAESESRRK